MLTEIEEKIAERLNAKITEPKSVAIDQAHGALAVPAIEVIVSGGEFARVAQHYKLRASVFVVVTFKHLRSTAERRKGVYPILEAIVACLVSQSLGLKIDGLDPKRLDNITEKEEAEEGKIVFQLEFETSFVIERLSDEAITDLFTIGLNYYLKPGDAVADATDGVVVQESPAPEPVP
jgi:hypothetical protein